MRSGPAKSGFWTGEIVSPASASFAVRIWAAMMLALYAAFWLQIEGAASAATCVAILAIQTRGAAFQKALYRLLGTAVGVTPPTPGLGRERRAQARHNRGFTSLR